MTCRQKKRKRPPPPPEPPASLVQLLQSDAAVRSYFESLQENLTADVQIWKDRHAKLKKENEQLRKRTLRKVESSQKARNATAASQKILSHNEASDRTRTAREKNQTALDPGVPVEDSMFDFESSEDDDEKEISEKEQHDVNTAEEADTAQKKPPAGQGEQQIDRKRYYCALQSAYLTLEKLGIELIDKEQDVSEESNLAQRDKGETNGTASSNVVRRSDEDVIMDIVNLVKRTDTEESSEKGTSPLLEKTSLIPFCNQANHPVFEHKQTLFDMFVLLDTLCSPRLTELEWESYFEDGAEAEEIKIGLRGRKTMVDKLLGAWATEIKHQWAHRDRVKRHTATLLHLNEVVDKKKDIGTLNVESSQSLPWIRNIVERCIIASLVTGHYLARGSGSDAESVVMEYVLSNAPSLGCESYPKLPPTLSFCVLESLLFPVCLQPQSDLPKWDESWLNKKHTSLLQAFAIACETTACIWSYRRFSSDDRIRDVALVECESFHRIRTKFPSLSLPSVEDLELATAKRKAEVRCRDLVGAETEFSTDLEWALQISAVVCGESEEVLLLMKSIFDRWCDGVYTRKRLPSIAEAMCQILSRQSESLQDLIPSPSGVSQKTKAEQYLYPFCSSFLRSNHSDISRELRMFLFVELLEASAKLGDGRALAQVGNAILTEGNKINIEDSDIVLRRHLYDTIYEIAQVPIVRVINLQRRVDRLKAFMAQAVCHNIAVVLAVASIEVENDAADDVDSQFCGNYAFDGQGRAVEAQTRLKNCVGSLKTLNGLVGLDWRPHDLMAFDRNAPDHDHRVLSSPSERACALSHICSWKGALRSMALPEVKPDIAGAKLLFRKPAHVKRLFKLAGFASGPALLHENRNMPPSPVCLIMEDDAILVDSFINRLQELLEELPRDFHFCSLGYSRPKSAPIVPVSPLVGVPSMLWYLTGYLISVEGARYLLDSLPVIGPVDSWIGLKMTANWDNVYGTRIGVGAHARVGTQVPTPGELSKILRFRAYCSLRPLCSQRVGPETGAPETGRSWRRRDTDVEYSGVVGLVQPS